MQIEGTLYDHAIIKGLSIDRTKNGVESDYFIYNDLEEMGIISYVPKYLQNPNEDPWKNQQVHDGAHKVIFWAYCNFKAGYKLNLLSPQGKELFEYPKDYSWKHIAVFETEMEVPPKFNSWSLSESF